MKLKQLMVGTLLLCIAGCGCNDDTTPPGGRPAVITVVLNAGTTAPALQVAPNAAAPVVPIDIFFLMDDGRDMERVFLGIIPLNPGDQRQRDFAAQRIFAQLQKKVEQKLKDRIAAAFANDPTQFPAGFDPATFNPQLDFAFGVGRYEDFGGDFWQGPSATALNQQARPFILNMPVLRAARPDFLPSFEAALTRTAPGDGNPLDAAGTRKSDPQSGIEGLYQVAAGPNTNFPSGFDADNADGDNDPSTGTLGSGAPCSLDPVLNPQDNPGTTGDVPSIRFGPAQPDPQDDQRDEYPVLDENGDPVLNGGTPCVASGNIGGVGWRDGAARFVILAGDIATVAPTDTAPQIGELVQSTDGNVPPPDAPRSAEAIPIFGFDGGAGRFGVAAGPTGTGAAGDLGVAPVGAHTLQQAIQALNALDIEVINLAAPDVVSNDTKPAFGGGTTVNGDNWPNDDIADVTDFTPTITPWTWMTGISRLTGAISPTKLSSQSGDNLALVYNLATVWPYNPTDPTGTDVAKQETDIKDDVVDDLVDRLMEWVQGGHLAAVGGGSGQEKPTLPQVFYDFEFFFLDEGEQQGSSDLVRTGPPGSSFLVENVQIPVNYNDETPPSPVEITFPEGTAFTFGTVTPDVPLPASDTFGFRIVARLNRIEGVTSENQSQANQIVQLIKERGDGFTVIPGESCPVPLSTEFDEIVQAEGTLLLTVRPDTLPGPTAILSSVVRGCAIVVDQAPGADSTPQVGGTCPFPQLPPSSCLTPPATLLRR